MSRHRRDPDETERELRVRYGIDPNPHADHFHEQELADRIREQASLTPGHHAAWQFARSRLGLGRSPYELPNAPFPPPRLRPGELVTYRGACGDEAPQHGTVERVLDEDQGAVVERFEGGARHALPGHALERRAGNGPAQTTAGATGCVRPRAQLSQTTPPGLARGDRRAQRRKRPRRPR
jgi:hypothetical protein